METVKIPAIVYDNTTPEGLILVEIGYHSTFNGFVCPFPSYIEPVYWTPIQVNEFSNFCAEQYNNAKNYGKTETLDTSSEI